MSSEFPAEMPQTRADAHLLPRELISGALLAGGLFWMAITVLLLLVPANSEGSTAERIAATVQQALGGGGLARPVLALLLISAGMMLAQSRALIAATASAGVLWIPGLIALAIQAYTAANGMLAVSGAFAVLVVAGLIYGSRWLAAVDTETSALPPLIEELAVPAAASTMAVVADDALPELEDRTPTLAGLTAIEPEELPASARIYSLSSRDAFPHASADDDNREAEADSGTLATLESLEHTLRFDELAKTDAALQDEPGLDQSDDLEKPSTEEVLMGVASEDARPGVAPAPLAPLNFEGGVTIGDLESTMELEVPSDLLEPEAEPDLNDDARRASREVIDDLEKTMVLDRPPIFDPPPR